MHDKSLFIYMYSEEHAVDMNPKYLIISKYNHGFILLLSSDLNF